MRGLRQLLVVIPLAAVLSACGSSTQSGSGGAGGPVHYVVVGNSGAVACSADGSSWSARKSGTDQDLKGVAASKDGKVVAVGASGTVLYSADGAKTFQTAAAPTSNDLQAVAVDGADHFVIAGDDTKAYFSDDGGKTWNAGKAIDSTTNLLIRSLVADGTNRFLAAGTYYQSSASGIDYRSRVYLSTDGGQSWKNVFDRDLSANGGSVADGLESVATDGSQHYVTVGGKSQAFFVSGDPTSTWTASSGLAADLKLMAVAWDDSNQRFVAGDQSGSIYSSSDNGQSFKAGCAPLQGQSSVSAIAAGGGGFMAVGPSLAIVSRDGGDTCTTLPIAVNNSNLIVFGVAYLP